MVPLSFQIRVCFLWTNGIFGYSARGTKVHLYWFIGNWWQSWPSVWVYIYVFVHRLHTCNLHMCTRTILHTCDTHYLLCLPSLFLLSLPLTSFPPSFLYLPHTYLSLSFTTLPFTHTSPLYRIVVYINSGSSTQIVTSYRPMVLYDHLPKLSLMVGMLLWSSPNHSPSPSLELPMATM